MNKRPALGRGLAALIPEAPRAQARPEPTGLQTLALDAIVANQLQPRHFFDERELADLASSIKEHGILQPVVVRPVAGGGYELIAGERRVRAARLAGLVAVPALIREPSTEGMLELALIENVQRDDLNAIELARAFNSLQESFGYSHEQISKRVGKDRSTITNHIRLLQLPDEVQSSLIEGTITMGHARALLGLESGEAIRSAWRVVVDKKMTVRETEALVQRAREVEAPRTRARRERHASAEIVHLTDRLRRVLSADVRITPRKQGGRIEIDFHNHEELDRFLDRILAE